MSPGAALGWVTVPELARRPDTDLPLLKHEQRALHGNLRDWQ